jgi:hypothetical protein
MAAGFRLVWTADAVRTLLVVPIALAAAACDRANAPGTGNEVNSAAEANALLQAAEENAAALAQDEDLANQAAADEAADMDIFGGNAAAGESANSAPDLAADGNTAS